MTLSASVVGIYTGCEDNVFWTRTGTSITAAGANSLAAGKFATLDRDAIHSVLDPIGNRACAIHVFGGDLFAPPTPRSEWDHQTMTEQLWNVEHAKALFREAEAHYRATTV